MKKCSRCKEIKTINEFGKNKSKKSGLQSYCIECVKQYTQTEKFKAYQKEYRQTEGYKESNRKDSNKYRQGKSIPNITINAKKKVLSRYLMEQEIGRELLLTEIVHHKDENPFNNNIENLQLCKNHEEHMKIHVEIRYLRKELKNFTFSH